MTRPLLTLVALAAIAGASCGRPCRGIATVPIDLACDGLGTFTGELHFDDRATFETFLAGAQCIPDATDEQRAAIAGSVDFLTNVAFIAVGDRAQLGRCIEAREADAVEVCDDGLRIAFADRISDDTACGGKWTIALQVPRAEMRAALQDDDDL